MTKVSTLALAAAILLVPSLAIAQDTGVSVDAGAAVSGAVSGAVGDNTVAGSADASASASASASADLSFDDLLSDLESDDWSAHVTAVTSATADASITIVEVSSLEGSASASATALADAAARNQDRLSALHAAIGANAAIQAKLTASGHDTDDVIAVRSDAEGSLWIYVDEAE